jgi:hypothetical protein
MRCPSRIDVVTQFGPGDNPGPPERIYDLQCELEEGHPGDHLTVGQEWSESRPCVLYQF